MPKEHVSSLTEPSVAVQSIDVSLPTPNVVPETEVQATVGAASQTSVALAAKVTAVPAGLVGSTAMSAGHVITGCVVSSTVI